jgi:hypothetical protein
MILLLFALFILGVVVLFGCAHSAAEDRNRKLIDQIRLARGEDLRGPIMKLVDWIFDGIRNAVIGKRDK